MFRSYTDLVRVPIKNSTNLEEVFSCELCKTTWLSELELDLHRKKVHIMELKSKMRCKSNFMCLICLRPQDTEVNLLTHIKTIHLLSSPHAQKIERQIYICDYCNSLFFNKYLLTVHIHSRHIKSRMDIDCELCHKQMSFKKTWFHMSNLHDINDRTTCPICAKRCGTALLLNDHLQSHIPYFNCTFCNYTTTRKSYYVQHLQKHKEDNVSLRGSKKYKHCFTRVHKFSCYDIYIGLKGIRLYNLRVCVICRQICRNEKEMKRHVRTMHAHSDQSEKKQSYLCVCGEEFFNSVLLKHHVFKKKGCHADAMYIAEKSKSLEYNSPYIGVEVLDSSMVEVHCEPIDEDNPSLKDCDQNIDISGLKKQ